MAIDELPPHKCKGCPESADWRVNYCSPACEKRDLEAREQARPKPPAPQTTIASAMRELAELRGEYDYDRRVNDLIQKAVLVRGGDEFEYRGGVWPDGNSPRRKNATSAPAPAILKRLRDNLLNDSG
jgi:hypothetical protein